MAAERPLRLDRNTAAGVLARQADRGEPESGERHRVLGLLVEAQRRLRTEEIAAAERALRRALAIAPGHADALNLMSVVQGRQGRAAEGERCSRQALARKPDDPGYRLNLANRLNEQSRVEEAIEAYGRVLEVAPRHLQALKALARTLAEAGRLEEAAGVARSALDCPDAEAETLAECGEITAAYGDVRGALALYRRACEELPDQPGWWLQVARLELRLDQAEAGVAAALRVLALEPGHAEAIILQSAGLHRMRQFERVLQVLDGVEIEGPHAANAANLRAMALVAQGRVEEGLGAMRAVEGLAPDSVTLQMTRLMYLNYHPDLEQAALSEEHRRFGAAFGGQSFPAVHHFQRSRDPERRLRVGYLSPDFRLHSVAYFTAPIFQAYDRDRFETFAYAHVVTPDPVSQHLAGLVDRWQDVSRLDDEALARLIREDGIDILVELAGLTKDSRLMACVGRPAPVQISYLGYPNTTGLPQIDYRITDHLADPEDADDFYTETLIRLPRCFLCYAIPRHAPPVQPPPHETNGYVTFGSFNNLAKVNRQVIQAWAGVLQSVPGSRLLLKATGTAERPTQDYLLGAFREAGVAPSRIDLSPYTQTAADHLETYNQVDIALDTFPYNGTTTTCEALWMGVPVITLAGDRHASRVGTSLLSAVGFTAGVARDLDDYVLTARLLAGQPPLLAKARRNLRADLVRSPLCDMRGHARALEEAYRAVWRLWCESA